MSYTVSFDASIKVKAGDMTGWLLHAARDIDARRGIEHDHNNPDIDADLTPDNVTWVYDADTGKYARCNDMMRARTAINRRLEDVTKPLRKDAVLGRGIILQMSPDWYAGHTDEEARACEKTMRAWLIGHYGARNIPVMALHQDEGSRGIHALLVPVTADGRLSQKDFFPNPADLSKTHQEFRQYMKEHGYDVEQQNIKETKYVKRLSEKDYKQLKKDQNEAKRLKQQYTRANDHVKELAQQLQAREKTLDDREDTIKRRESRVHRREQEEEAHRKAQEAREEILQRREVETRRREQEATEAIETAQEAITACKRLRLTVEERVRMSELSRLETRLGNAASYNSDSYEVSL